MQASLFEEYCCEASLWQPCGPEQYDLTEVEIMFASFFLIFSCYRKKKRWGPGALGLEELVSSFL